MTRQGVTNRRVDLLVRYRDRSVRMRTGTLIVKCLPPVFNHCRHNKPFGRLAEAIAISVP